MHSFPAVGTEFPFAVDIITGIIKAMLTIAAHAHFALAQIKPCTAILLRMCIGCDIEN